MEVIFAAVPTMVSPVVESLSIWAPFWSLFHLTAFLLVSFHCLQNRRAPNSTILWIFVSLSFPVIGPLLYLSFGVDRVKDMAFKKHLTDQQLHNAGLGKDQDMLPLVYWESLHKNMGTVDSVFESGLARIVGSLQPSHSVLPGNVLTPLVDGDEAYPCMLESIRAAKDHIHLQSFIIGNDKSGRKIMDALLCKAKEGVKVRVLYDRFGSTYALLSGFFLRYKKCLDMEVAGWTQANIFKRQFQVNLRNHRKIMVVDGKVGFIGGMNIHSENEMSDQGRAAIRDYHFRVAGPIVHELQYSFLKDWYFAKETDPETILTSSYFPAPEVAGSDDVIFISGGPTETETGVVTGTVFATIAEANKQVLLVTPYLVPSEDILRILMHAGFSGVDVRILLPKNNNHRYAGWASKALYEELLGAGVRIFERDDPFMHSKALIVDGCISFVGTANLDARSLNLNYETNLLIHSEDFASRLKRIVLADFAQSTEVQLADWIKRSSFSKIKENLCHLMSPVL